MVYSIRKQCKNKKKINFFLYANKKIRIVGGNVVTFSVGTVFLLCLVGGIKNFNSETFFNELTYVELRYSKFVQSFVHNFFSVHKQKSIKKLLVRHLCNK